MIESIRKLQELDKSYLTERAKLEAATQAELKALLPLPAGWEYLEKGGYWCAEQPDGFGHVTFSERGLEAVHQYPDETAPVPEDVVVAVLRANGVIL